MAGGAAREGGGREAPALSGDPLTGVRVLITRTPDRAAELADLLRARGALPQLVPIQEPEPVQGPERERLAQLLQLAAGAPDRPRASGPVWLVVTSANTVRALAELASSQGSELVTVLSGDSRGSRDSRGCAAAVRLRIAAVGPATARELARHGLEADLLPQGAASAQGLLATWGSEAQGGPGRSPGTVLLPQSAAARPLLAQGLEGFGWEVRAAVAYRMAPWSAPRPLRAPPVEESPGDSAGDGTRDPVLERRLAEAAWTVPQAQQEIGAGRVRAAVLTAPSAVRALAGSSPERLAALALVAIGAPTRQQAEQLGLHAAEAASTEPADLAEALTTALERAGPSSSSIGGPFDGSGVPAGAAAPHQNGSPSTAPRSAREADHMNRRTP